MEQWQLKIESLIDKFYKSDLMPAYKAVDRAVSVGFAANFASRVDETGMAWRPHAPATIAMYGVHDLLILSGAMYAAATRPEGLGHIFRVNGNEVTIGVDGVIIPYAIVHHVGTARVPRRRVIYVNDVTLGKAFETFQSIVTAIIGA